MNPNTLPRWEPAPEDVVEPNEGKKDEGWQPSEPLPAQTMNWFWSSTYKWLQYIYGWLTGEGPGIRGKGITGGEAGVHGKGAAGGVGVYGEGGSYGVQGVGGGSAAGVYGVGGTTGEGVKGIGFGGADGVLGQVAAGGGSGVAGEAVDTAGVHGESTSGTGVYGASQTGAGVVGKSTSGVGVHAESLGVRGALHLVPLASAPSGNEEGDIYYDSTIKAPRYNDGTGYQSLLSGGRLVYGQVNIAAGVINNTNGSGFSASLADGGLKLEWDTPATWSTIIATVGGDAGQLLSVRRSAADSSSVTLVVVGDSGDVDLSHVSSTFGVDFIRIYP